MHQTFVTALAKSIHFTRKYSKANGSDITCTFYCSIILKNEIMSRFTVWSKPAVLSLPSEQALKNQRWTRFSVKDDNGASSLLGRTLTKL